MGFFKSKAFIKGAILFGVFLILMTIAILYVHFSQIKINKVFEQEVSTVYYEGQNLNSNITNLETYTKNKTEGQSVKYQTISLKAKSNAKFSTLSFYVDSDSEQVVQLKVIHNSDEISSGHYIFNKNTLITISISVNLKTSDIIQLVFENLDTPINIYKLSIKK